MVSKKYKIEKLSSTLIYFKYNDNCIIDVADVKEMFIDQNEFVVNNLTKRIIHAGKYTNITFEARDYIEQNKPQYRAEAFVLNNLSQQILFNFYAKLRKKKNPIKSFNSLEKAKKWLESIN